MSLRTTPCRFFFGITVAAIACAGILGAQTDKNAQVTAKKADPTHVQCSSNDPFWSHGQPFTLTLDLNDDTGRYTGFHSADFTYDYDWTPEATRTKTRGRTRTLHAVWTLASSTKLETNQIRLVFTAVCPLKGGAAKTPASGKHSRENHADVKTPGGCGTCVGPIGAQFTKDITVYTLDSKGKVTASEKVTVLEYVPIDLKTPIEEQ